MTGIFDTIKKWGPALSEDDVALEVITGLHRDKTLGAGRWHVAVVGELVRRLRDRVQSQEQRIAALEARLTALEQQVGRLPDR